MINFIVDATNLLLRARSLLIFEFNGTFVCRGAAFIILGISCTKSAALLSILEMIMCSLAELTLAAFQVQFSAASSQTKEQEKKQKKKGWHTELTK